MKPYRDNGRILVDVQQVIPLPEAADYQVKLRGKAERERIDRRTKTEREHILQSFWTGLLGKANECTDLHSGVSAGREYWLATGAGSVSGLSFVYGIGKNSPRVTMSISTGDRDRNDQIFDKIATHKSVIEERFGSPLGWDNRAEMKDRHIKYDLDISWTRDDAAWPEIQDKMVEVMCRLESALRPVLDELKKA